MTTDHQVDFAFRSLAVATAPGLKQTLSPDRIASLADEAFLDAGRPRASHQGVALPWIAGWKAVNVRLAREIRHANGLSHSEVIEEAKELVGDLSDQDVDRFRRHLRITSEHLYLSKAHDLRSHLLANAGDAYRRCALSLLQEGKLIAFETKPYGLTLKPVRNWRAWDLRSKDRAKDAMRFLIVQDLPHVLRDGDPGGLRTRAQVGAEQAAGEALRQLSAAPAAPRKADVLAYLMWRFEGLSGKGAQRVWDAEAPARWKRPGRKAEALSDLLPENWPVMPKRI